MKQIYIAAGCFWGAQAFFDKAKGVISTSVVYLNGGFEGVTYKQVCQSSGHVEAVEINYDENLITEKQLWNLFLQIVNPYSLNKQGGDKGVQYRIGIYSKSEQLLKVFAQFQKDFQASENRPNYIEILPVNDVSLAEEYHQKYLEKNPNGYCHINLDLFPIELKKEKSE
ncbi:peptide-methionine (S)-S-oxide reductase [Mesomycoplasma conjunctivae]|uniref:Peptide methionine sulfoxide reductase MsrA n=1 Tax=Mesomycoplasma conjunctivae (strain ATCC 25834 / NCTC 10147 / HRC/581) TaxID=572263 RepID=C5J5R3_MESCH|nr:peptide-methionine (S)-S-oxide reductase MsrA [Mesomycoplasma conjunctivae]CAT04797.1 Peptide methionine sulfoxide reductase msrA [Mesomycoplasma conjunctivae]VEU65822.1 peptide-methionine (S)-S-oxide reductase [Mesomycoplasma conjunctivae]